jgi:hypothetical protein
MHKFIKYWSKLSNLQVLGSISTIYQVSALDLAFYKLLDQSAPTWQVIVWWMHFTHLLLILLYPFHRKALFLPI